MEIQDGFIVGIHDYCDRWCEVCAFTSRCRAFAIEADTHIPGAPAAIPRGATVVRVEGVVSSTAALSQMLAPEHRHIEARAKGYAFHAGPWLRERGLAVAAGRSNADDPLELIQRYLLFIPGKVFRALSHLRFADAEYERDAEGSAKAAIVAIDKSRQAWWRVAAERKVTVLEIQPFVGDLRHLGESLSRVFPSARAFVRPGIDEAGEVARLS